MLTAARSAAYSDVFDSLWLYMKPQTLEYTPDMCTASMLAANLPVVIMGLSHVGKLLLSTCQLCRQLVPVLHQLSTGLLGFFQLLGRDVTFTYAIETPQSRALQHRVHRIHMTMPSCASAQAHPSGPVDYNHMHQLGSADTGYTKAQMED